MSLGLITAPVCFAAAKNAPLESTNGVSGSAAPETKELIFIGQGFRNKSLILNSNLQHVGTTPAPDGAFAFDAQAILYDAPFNSSSTLMIIAPPYTKLSTQIDFPNYIVEDVAVDPHSAVFSVTIAGLSDYVEFFRHGATYPCAAVPKPSGVETFRPGSSFDREGRLFFNVSLSDGTLAIASIAGQCKAGTGQVDALPSNSIAPSAHLQFNADDNLVFEDLFTSHVLTFAHPQNNQFGQPLTTTVLQLPQRTTQAYFLCLTDDGSHLLADYGVGGGPTKTLSEFSYPAGGAAIASIALRQAAGCGVTPPLLP